MKDCSSYPLPSCPVARSRSPCTPVLPSVPRLSLLWARALSAATGARRGRRASLISFKASGSRLLPRVTGSFLPTLGEPPDPASAPSPRAPRSPPEALRTPLPVTAPTAPQPGLLCRGPSEARPRVPGAPLRPDAPAQRRLWSSSSLLRVRTRFIPGAVSCSLQKYTLREHPRAQAPGRAPG